MTSHADAAVFKTFSPVEAQTSGLHIYDFIGTCTRTSFRKGWDKHLTPAGRKFTPNLPPKNEHYLDWVAVLSAVDRARGAFRMAELGAGWAPWLVRGALAARQRPEISSVELLGVEADPTHFAWMRQHFVDNGLDPDAHFLLNGAVAAQPGVLSFPIIENPDEDYGSGIVSPEAAARTLTVKAHTLPELLALFSGPVDFMHVDIQGAEYEAIPPALSVLNGQVRSLMVGTHTSDAWHDDLVRQLRSAGWHEVLNLPRSRTSQTPWGDIALGDGFLLFDNPRLL